MTPEDLLQQLLQFLGKPVEREDPSNPNQCMDWAFAICDILGIDRATIRHMFAYQVWTQPQDISVKYFEFVPNTPNGVPPQGFVIFDKNVPGVTGDAGHICWSIGKGDSNSFQSLDQNWAGKQYVTEETHSYVGVLGWLVPRIFIQGDCSVEQAQANDNWNICQAWAAALGIQLDPNNKEASKQEGVQAINDLKQKLSEDLATIAGIKQTDSDILAKDANLAQEVLDAQKALQSTVDDRKTIYDLLAVSNTKDALDAIQALKTPHEEVVKQVQPTLDKLAEAAFYQRIPKTQSFINAVKNTFSVVWSFIFGK